MVTHQFLVLRFEVRALAGQHIEYRGVEQSGSSLGS